MGCRHSAYAVFPTQAIVLTIFDRTHLRGGATNNAQSLLAGCAVARAVARIARASVPVPGGVVLRAGLAYPRMVTWVPTLGAWYVPELALGVLVVRPATLLARR